MPVIGFDSFVLNRPIVEMPSVPPDISPSVFRPSEASQNRAYELVFKATVGASVRTRDEDGFRAAYEQALSNALAAFRVPQKRPIYKAADLAKQSLHNTPYIISSLLKDLEPIIDRVDIYCAYYNQPYVSCFGEAAGERVLPVIFIERNQNAFPHVCAWKCLTDYPLETDVAFQLDHFTSKITPAWRVLSQSNVEIQVFYDGGHCNPLIATSDVILRLIELFQYGTVDGRSLLSTVSNHVPSLQSKLRFHNLGGRGVDQHHTAPVVRLDIDLSNCLKRPIYFVIWKPAGGRTDLKHSFEWGKFYVGILAEAMRTKGCVKLFNPEIDMLYWDPTRDFVSPFGPDDEAYLNNIRDLGHAVPPVFRPTV
jgi:hypothetical protein